MQIQSTLAIRSKVQNIWGSIAILLLSKENTPLYQVNISIQHPIPVVGNYLRVMSKITLPYVFLHWSEKIFCLYDASNRKGFFFHFVHIAYFCFHYISWVLEYPQLSGTYPSFPAILHWFHSWSPPPLQAGCPDSRGSVALCYLVYLYRGYEIILITIVPTCIGLVHISLLFRVSKYMYFIDWVN